MRRIKESENKRNIKYQTKKKIVEKLKRKLKKIKMSDY